MECPICFEARDHFFDAKCGHKWCVACQARMRNHSLRTCPMCRAYVEDFLLPLEPMRLLGSKELPRIKWRVKRYRRRERRAAFNNW
jgi:hypothetical protein